MSLTEMESLVVESSHINGFLAGSSVFNWVIRETAQTDRSPWATPERLEIEKRVLKKRLLIWDREFETKNGRKPEKEDRMVIRHVFATYQAIKQLLVVIRGEENVHSWNHIERMEKRALQLVLKLFEQDFEEKQRRKVETRKDIEEREME